MQAPIENDVFVEMPRLYASPGKVWKLKRSIYGLKDSPRNYFLHTKKQLEHLGFTQSASDPCLFISDTVICLIYVDDALLVYENERAVDDLTNKMKKMGILFEEEDDVAGHLGVLIDRDKDKGLITLRQGGLAKRIVEALHLDNNSPSSAPTRNPTEGCLPINKAGEPALGLYNYASVAGMLQHLQGHSRPDIAFAMSQVSRFVHSPKQSHKEALERMGRCLKGTTNGVATHANTILSWGISLKG